MPYLKITINKSIDAERKNSLLKAASKTVATELGKPEQYVMVSVETPVPMLFAGTEEPCAFLELRGIGIPEAKTGKLSELLCGLVKSETGIRRDRGYINFADIRPSMRAGTGKPFDGSVGHSGRIDEWAWRHLTNGFAERRVRTVSVK